MHEFRLPDVGEGVHEGELVEWLVSEGDAVAEDQPVAKVETDKALVDVPAPVDGTVGELRWSEGDVVPVGDVLLTFDVTGEVDEAALEAEPEPANEGAAPTSEGAAPATEDSDAGTEPAAEESEPASAEADSRGVSGATDSPDAEADAGETAEETTEETTGDEATERTGGGRVFAPPSVRRLARELEVDLGRLDGSGPGGRVTEQDVRAASGGTAEPGDADAQAADAEGQPGDAQPSAAATSDGDAASEGGRTRMEWGRRSDDDEEESAGATAASSGEATAESSGEAAASADRDRTLAAPATRRVARELDVDLDAVPAVEERDGQPFVTEDAVREYAETQRRAQATDAGAVSAGRERAGTTDSGARERREPYRGVRRSIGEAMAESKFTAPHVTHTDDVDVTRLVETKERLAARAEERGIRLTVTPFVLKAVAAALKEHPSLNAQLDEAAEEIVYKEHYDLGVATATDAGLMVPVVEGVDRKGLLQIASELNELVEQARDRSIAPEDLRGSTFTVTNVGAIGGEYATPIVNYPEVAILALGQIRRKPRVVEADDGSESIEPRSILPLSLSFDHRVVDGAMAAQFTNAVRERLRDPELLLLE